MAYGTKDAGSNRFISIILVVLIHVGLGFALVLGLGYEGVKEIAKTMTTFDVQEEVPEPEELPPPEPQDTPPPPPVTVPPTPFSPPSPIKKPAQPINKPVNFTPKATCWNGSQAETQAQCPPDTRATCQNGTKVANVSMCPENQKKPEKSCAGYPGKMFPADQACPRPPEPPKAAKPKGNPGSWVTPADYPRRALSDNAEGTTGFSVQIDANGRVTSCSITSSSGNSELDAATCKNVERRARFSPAEQDGQKVAGSYSNRVRWQIPK